jgi:site-specific DNA-methyltransferase (cytosine-N4-specific)
MTTDTPPFVLLEGDVTKIMASLALQGNVAHMVATSTPYFRQRKYEVPDTAWPAVCYAPIYGLPYLITVPEWTGQLGREDDPIAFIGHLIHVFRLIRWVLRDDGTIWVNLGDKYVGDGGEQAGRKAKNSVRTREVTDAPPGDFMPPEKNLLGIPARFLLAMQADGWWYRNDVVWHKPNASPHPVTDRLTVDHESIMLFSKQPSYYFDIEAIRTPLAPSTVARDTYRRAMEHKAEHEAAQGGSVRHDHETISNPAGAQKRTVWSIATRHAIGGHYAIWPKDLPETMIRAGTSEYGVCGDCGAPYVRIVEKPKPPPELTGQKQDRRSIPGQPDVIDRRRNNRALQDWRAANPPRTVGWKKPCACKTDAIQRPLVLDPFSGEASTGEAALALGRNYLGIDADGKSIKVARKRLKVFLTNPLFEPPPVVATAGALSSLEA